VRFFIHTMLRAPVYLSKGARRETTIIEGRPSAVRFDTRRAVRSGREDPITLPIRRTLAPQEFGGAGVQLTLHFRGPVENDRPRFYLTGHLYWSYEDERHGIQGSVPRPD